MSKTMTSETVSEDLQALLDSGNIFGARMLMDDVLSHLSSKIERIRDETPYSAAGDALDTQLDLQLRRVSEIAEALDRTDIEFERKLIAIRERYRREHNDI